MERQRKLKYKEIVSEGELVEVKTLAEHEMESGVRRDEKTGPRQSCELATVASHSRRPAPVAEPVGRGQSAAR